MAADDPITPCSDRGCILRTERHRGQATNGGCEHLKMTDVRALRRLLRLLAADRARLAQAATRYISAHACSFDCDTHDDLSAALGRCPVPGCAAHHEDGPRACVSRIPFIAKRGMKERAAHRGGGRGR